MKTILLLIAFAAIGCTCRDVTYKGVKYRSISFLSNQSAGKIGVEVKSNEVTAVTVENYANDQVSALREVKELVGELNNLKTP